MIVFVAFWLICGLIGWYIGDTKGRPGDGFALGVLLGPIGIIVIAAMGRSAKKEAEHQAEVAAVSARMGAPAESTPTMRACPWCAEQIQQAAIVCKHCGRNVESGQTT